VRSEWKALQVKGKIATIDADDLPLLSGHNLDVDAVGYLRLFKYCKDTKKTIHTHAHKLIMGEGIVDHINGNKLDNRRSNLRLTDKSGNSINRPKQRGKYLSQYRGVSKHKDRWRAYAEHKKVKHSLGVYDSETDAALARDKFWESTGEIFVRNII